MWSDGRATSADVKFTMAKQLHTERGSDRFHVHGIDAHVEPRIVEWSSCDVFEGTAAAAAESTDEWGDDLLPKKLRGATKGSHTTSGAATHPEASPETYPVLEGAIFSAVCGAAGLDMDLALSDSDTSSGTEDDVVSAAAATKAKHTTSPTDAHASATPTHSTSSSGSGVSSLGSHEGRAVTARNCLVELASVWSLEELQTKLGHPYNSRWEVVPNLNPTSSVLAKVRSIAGSSLRSDCRVHKDTARGKCKLHLNINAQFESCQALLLKWAVHGSGCSYDEHMDEATACAKLWREKLRSDA